MDVSVVTCELAERSETIALTPSLHPTLSKFNPVDIPQPV
jgi:hypothetical protein